MSVFIKNGMSLKAIYRETMSQTLKEANRLGLSKDDIVTFVLGNGEVFLIYEDKDSD